MAIARDDRWVTDAQGRALAGALVFWCTQPATINAAPPPAPLATIYTDISGTIPMPQPVITDGFGHADAYMDDSPLYTIVVYHPLFGPNALYNGAPVAVLKDQRLGGGGGGGGSTIISFSGVPQGTVDGTNKVFTVTNGGIVFVAPSLPTQFTAWLNFPLIQGIGYTLALVGTQLQITYTNAPQPASGDTPSDAIYAQGYIVI